MVVPWVLSVYISKWSLVQLAVFVLAQSAQVLIRTLLSLVREFLQPILLFLQAQLVLFQFFPPLIFVPQPLSLSLFVPISIFVPLFSIAKPALSYPFLPLVCVL